jgi:putative protease
MEELTKVSHREYTNGFYFGKPTEKHQLYTSNTYIQEYTIAAVAQTTQNGVTILEQRNKFEKGDVLEVINPKGENFSFTVGDMYDEWDNLIESAPHAQMTVKIKLPKEAEEFALLRMLNKNYKPEDM